MNMNMNRSNSNGLLGGPGSGSFGLLSCLGRTLSRSSDSGSFESPVPNLRSGIGGPPDGPPGAVESFFMPMNIHNRAPPSVRKQRRVYTIFPSATTSTSSENSTGAASAGGMEIHRASSLDETKVLASTSLLRTESIVIPELFNHMRHFDFIRRIGSSQYSEVWLVKHKYNQQLYAVKQRHFSSKDERNKCAREMQSVAELPPHDNIVFYYRSWQEDSYVFTQMDYCSGGTLKQKLEEQTTQTLSVEDILTLVLEVGRGLSFLEGHRILHLDLKPENIYLDSEGVYHIGDFGLAVLGSDWDWEEGDGRYLAPELLDDNAKATEKADIYSFGAVLFECATKKNVPRNRSTFTEDTFKDLECKLPRCLVDLIMSMLAVKPQDRPSADAIIHECDKIRRLLSLS